MGVNNAGSTTRPTEEDQLAAYIPPDAPPWYKQGHLLHLNFIIVSLVMYSSANGFDGSLMNGLEALDQWKDFMNHPAGSWLGWINAIYWLGCGVGYPTASWIANRWGRKPGVYVGYCFLALGCALQTAAPNDKAFLLARLFLGAASALFGNAVPLLINEIAYPSHRGILNSLFMSGWYVGGTVAAWVVFASRDYSSSWAWRLPSLLQLLVPLVGFPGFFLAPESPRWLVSVGRDDEARAILTRYHAAGDENSPLVNYEFQEIIATIRAEQQAASDGSYLEMIKTAGNRRRLMISITLGMFAQWVGNGVISYYLSLILTSVGVTNVRDQTLISACLQMWDLAFAALGAYLSDRLGRRPLFLASAVIMFVSYVLVTALSGSFAVTQNTATGGAVIPFLFIFFAGYCIALTPFLTGYPCEIWPYRLRSRGLTVTWVATIVGMFFNTFVNPIALAAIAWRYYIVFIAVLLVFGVTAFFFYPETKGYSLEQIAVIFDGPEALVGNATDIANATEDLKESGSFTAHEESV
ncbi:Major facilitator superfamily domain general substrate transporter [Penicillium atrosanguineum]|uniref:Major facilitator superfamily domain general substrate transporter n=1 Tax=Penicillium atrosanguineum TaxID=1132637 RepID=A0A9W9GXN2_9EURO|nr:Major facilitator superfamily domain general substrate transporter [Penicillium atrosanguineum]KAJ5137854.1 Major facilitator superfamily domain general substrate transporter [Penicillium atrosanguineum]KAJ5307422.1 Major facilitator superfamily domain general substrate transporter [Penicillium atrosanguineum]